MPKDGFPIILNSKLKGHGKINQIEFEAIVKAIEQFGKNSRICSDNTAAVSYARIAYPDVEIVWISGKSNPADKYTRKKIEPIEPPKPKNAKRFVERFQLVTVRTDSGEQVMTMGKYKRHMRRTLRKTIDKRKADNELMRIARIPLV